MENILLVIIGLLIVNAALSIALFLRKPEGARIQEDLQVLKKDVQDGQQQLKQDLFNTLQALNSTNNETISRLGNSNMEALRSLGQSLKESLEQSQRLQQEKLNALRDSQSTQLKAFNQGTNDQMAALTTRLDTLTKSNEDKLENLRKAVSDSLVTLTKSNEDKLENLRKAVSDSLVTLTKSNEDKLENLRKAVSDSLVTLQKQNDAKLEDIRVTVGEKLQTTLEQRLANSFNVVNQQLENVFKGLGEMRNLAGEVGGLKKVLGNVKLRGNLGEVQLGAIIEQLLAPEQYGVNVATVPGSSKRVEFAVKLPGKDDGLVYLPIDSKFPADTYNNLQEVKESGDKDAIKEAQKALRDRILSEAKDISEKYVKAPYTTDFAIMFLPFEGLYSEVLSLDMFNELQNKYHVMVAGPNTMAAMLNSLRMGFKTLALQKRSGEISKVLEAVKTEFEKFGDCLKKMKGHLDSTSKDLDELMGARTKKINTKLRSFDTIEPSAAQNILQISENSAFDGE